MLCTFPPSFSSTSNGRFTTVFGVSSAPAVGCWFALHGTTLPGSIGQHDYCAVISSRSYCVRQPAVKVRKIRTGNKSLFTIVRAKEKTAAVGVEEGASPRRMWRLCERAVRGSGRAEGS